MSVTGLGCDIVEIYRIKRSYDSSPSFGKRVYTENELKYCLNHAALYQHLAGRFAAKEAVGKAIGCSLSWQDVEITNNEQGKPCVILHGKAKKIAGNKKMHLTISHSETCAMAVAIMED